MEVIGAGEMTEYNTRGLALFVVAILRRMTRQVLTYAKRYRACKKPVVALPLCANSKHAYQKTHKHTIFIELDQ